MKSYYLLFILFVINGYTFAQNETNEILDYPSYSDVIFNYCRYNFNFFHIET